MRVRLLIDLIQYDEHLVKGAIGTAREDKITYNDWEEEMVEVKIPGANALPIGWKALDIIDKGYLSSRERDIKQAVKIQYMVGPRGGFKGMRIYSVGRDKIQRVFTTNIKHEAEKLVVLANKYNKKVSEEVIRNNYECR